MHEKTFESARENARLPLKIFKKLSVKNQFLSFHVEKKNTAGAGARQSRPAAVLDFLNRCPFFCCDFTIFLLIAN